MSTWSTCRFLVLEGLLGLFLAGCAASADSTAAPANELFSTQTQMTQGDPALSLNRPALNSLERTNWEKVTVGPVRANVQHPPRYFTEKDRIGGHLGGHVARWVKSPMRPSPLMEDPDLEEQARRATDGGNFHYSTDGWADLGLGTVKFGLDLIQLPLRVLGNPPWAPEK